MSSCSKTTCSACTFDNNPTAVFCQACNFDLTTNFKSGNPSKHTKNIASRIYGSIRDVKHVVKTYLLNSPPEVETIGGDDHRVTEHFGSSPFCDLNFEPDSRSLCFEPDERNLQNIIWLRPSQIRTSNKAAWTLLRTPLPSDISQGVIGNCWLLSALSVLAECPRLIHKIFVQHDFQRGMYQLRLCVDGIWQNVVVDDMLPCDIQTRRLVYAEAKRNQIWVAIIEKAMAKVHGCYEALISGRVIEGLMMLTGQPCFTVDLQKKNVDLTMVWAQLLSCRSSGFLMGASCGSGNMEVDESLYNKLGLKPRHAYAILDVKHIFSDIQLILLRNPWGHITWKGDWSDSSLLWTPEIRNALQIPHIADSGTFWMSYVDFCKYFDSIDVCKLSNERELRTSEVMPDNARKHECEVFHLTVFETTEIDFSFHQFGHRLIRRNQTSSSQHVSDERSQHQLIDFCILIFRSSESQPALGKLLSNSDRLVRGFGFHTSLLEPGCYLVFCLAFNHLNRVNHLCQSSIEQKSKIEYSLALHTPTSTTALHLEKLKVNSNDFMKQSPYLLADALIQMVLSKGIRNEGGEGVSIYHLSRSFSGLIVVVENRQPSTYFAHVKCDCSENSFNVVSTRQSMISWDVVPPLHRQIVMLLTHLEGSSAYAISHRLTHKLSTSQYLCDNSALRFDSSTSESRVVGPPSNHPNTNKCYSKRLKHEPNIIADIEGLHSLRPI